jgi:hypothetical protein
MGFYFHQPSYNSYFSYPRVVWIEIGLIEGFSQIWKIRIIWNSQRRVIIQVSFNSHNAQYYFSCTTQLFCVTRKYTYLQLSQFILAHMNSSILRKHCAEYVNKVGLVKACM